VTVGRVDAHDGRYYVDPANPDLVYDSVTTIIGATTNKAYLTGWAARLAADFAVDHYDLVGMTLNEAGPDAAKNLIANASERYRNYRRDLGSRIHNMAENLNLDLPLPSFDELNAEELAEVDEFVDGYVAFLCDHEPVIEMSEATVANVIYGYAGTLDSVMVFPAMRRRLLVDIKSGKNLDDTIGEQLVGYRRCDEVWLPNGQKAPMPEVDGRAVLHLSCDYPDGYKLFEIVDTPEQEQEAFDRFLHRVAVVRAGKGAKLRTKALYKPLPDGSQPSPLIEDIDDLGRARGPLIAAGLRTLEEVLALTDAQLMSIKGIGAKSLLMIRILGEPAQQAA
jgi:hypothetical protein